MLGALLVAARVLTGVYAVLIRLLLYVCVLIGLLSKQEQSYNIIITIHETQYYRVEITPLLISRVSQSLVTLYATIADGDVEKTRAYASGHSILITNETSIVSQ